MYLKLTEQEIEVINRFENEMMIDMELYGDMLPIEGIVTVLEDILIRINYLNEKIDDLKSQLNEKGEEPLW